MQILVTGGAGFIGSNVVNAYLKKGHRVVIVDNLSTGKLKNIPKKAKFYKADICDFKTLEKIFKKEKFNIVNHHAAQIDVRASLARPQWDAKINILGGMNLLELCHKYRVKKFIYGSTGGALYGEMGKNPPDENSLIRSLSPYGVSKYCLERYLLLYQTLYGLPFTVLRYSNVYGPRQNPLGEGGVIAIFIHSFLTGKTPTIFGNGKQLRDFVFVEDVAKANLLALHRAPNKAINIGCGKTTSILQLFDILKEKFCSDIKPKWKPARRGEILKSGLHIDTAKRVLRWYPSHTLKEGLTKTIFWQKSDGQA